MDLYSRAIVGWHLSDKLSTVGILRGIEKAKANRKIDSPLIIHSDRGVQYISKAYIEATPANSFIRSYSRKGNP
jgi:putative transposase